MNYERRSEESGVKLDIETYAQLIGANNGRKLRVVDTPRVGVDGLREALKEKYGTKNEGPEQSQ